MSSSVQRGMCLSNSFIDFCLVIGVQKGQCTSDSIIGQGNTTAWKMNGLNKETTLSLFFEVVPKEASEMTSQDRQQFFFQFLT